VIFEPGEKKTHIYFSTYHLPTLINLFHRFTSAPKPAEQKFLTVVSETSAPPFQLLRHQRNDFHASCQPLYATNTSHLKQETFLAIRSIIQRINPCPRLLVNFRTKLIFYVEVLLAPRPTPKREDHPLSASRISLFSIFAATLLIWTPSPLTAT
jgi:hypothetical protein